MEASICIAFANLKGGTGKTTTCINVAGCLAQNNAHSKVLVVDFDPQGNATSGLGIDGKTLEYSIYDALLNDCEDYDGVPITQTVLETEVENLHLAPSELDLSAMPMILQRTRNRVGILNQVLEPVRNFYDYILIDVPSDTGLFLLNGLRAADRVVVPIDSGIFSLESLEKLKIYGDDIQQMTGHGINDFIIVLNRYQKLRGSAKNKTNLSPSEEIESQIQEMSYTMFTVPESVLIYRSQQEGMPISHYAPTSKIAKAFEEIANYLAL